MPKINHEEYEILKGLDDKWEWIARDDNYSGLIFCFRKKPHKDIRNGEWGPDATQYKYLGEYELLFQFIQWEDPEPYNISELIKEYEYHEVLWYRDNKGVPKLSGSTLRSVLKSNSKDRYQFTEQEIKDYDERFWPFAVKVEELGE